MKTLKYIFTAATGLLMLSCYSLDILPKTTITEDLLLDSDGGIQRYLAICYHELPIEDFLYSPNDGYGGIGRANRWEIQKNSPALPGGEAVIFGNGQNENYQYWTARGDVGVWYRIRDLNQFLTQIPNYEHLHSATAYQSYIAEARFLRAYYYFALVRRYGGVPLLTVTQNPGTPIEDMKVPRSTEYDSWKFIYEDLKFAMENGSTAKVRGRANRYVAAALMSRAMLYAGSIAKYGPNNSITPVPNSSGVLGIAANRAEEFFQYSYDAAKFIEENGYSLHQNADKEAGFVEVFQTYTNEDIFVKEYRNSNSGAAINQSLYHVWDMSVLPAAPGLSQGPGIFIHPAWNVVGLFDHPAIEDAEGKPVRFDTPEAFWQSEDMEPRLRASVYFHGMTEQASGVVFDLLAGVYTDYPGTVADGTPDAPNGESPEGGYTGRNNAGRRKTSNNKSFEMDIAGYGKVKVSGEHGTGNGPESRSNTGMIVRKYVSNNVSERVLDPMAARGQQPWKVFRYGEILLNRAEAAYELGLIKNDEALKAEAFQHIAAIRDRAGAKPHAMVVAPAVNSDWGVPIDENMQFIRDERARELLFENHRWFDLLRWRVGHYMFRQGSQYVLRGLYLYRVLDENKWIFLPEVRRFAYDWKNVMNENHYYRPIPNDAIARNQNLERNEGY